MNLKFIFIIFSAFLFSCASLLVEETIIKGKVQLSDNPSYGHGNVLVSSGPISTFTNSDGTFELKGDVFNDITLKVNFQRTLYIDKSIEVEVQYPAEGDKNAIEVDVGKVVLQRATENYITVFSDDFNRIQVGNNYQTNGNVSINNGKLLLDSPTNASINAKAFIITSNANLTDMAITFDFDNGADGNYNNITYIYLRYIDENNFYRVKITELSGFPTIHRVLIERKFEGSIYSYNDQFVSTLLNPGRYEFKILYNELTFKNVSGGTNINFRVIDEKITGYGRCGFEVDGETSSFDNIVLSDVEYN